MNTGVKNDPQLIAYCGLYCGACGKYQKEKCPGCKQIQGKHCRKFNNPISKVFAFIFGSNREKCILSIRENGAIWYAAHMAETGQQSLKGK